MLLMAIISALAVPRFAGFLAEQRLDAAGRRIVTDIALAKRHSKHNSAALPVTFSSVSDTYTVSGLSDPDHPSASYVVRLGEEPYGVDVVSADFGGDAELRFDGYGTPDSGGTVVLRVGTRTRTVSVEAGSGTPKVIGVGQLEVN